LRRRETNYSSRCKDKIDSTAMQDAEKTAALCSAHIIAIDSALSNGRINRYLTVARGDRVLALRYYLWNSELCEAFYIPLQLAEIAARNCILKAVVARYGTNWYADEAFRKQLAPECLADLNQSIRDERKQHGSGMTHEHVASSVSFSFWDHLCTQRFRPLLWAKGILPYFPHFPDNTDLYKLQAQVMSIRQWRNRIAHYKAIFDKQPTQKHNDILELLSWVSPDLREFVRGLSRVSRVIGQRPA
jgi:hypothetical protein